MERDTYFDNMKFVLIMLVVIGHIIGPVNPVVPAYKALFVFIYLFHMPLFAFISGYFTSEKIDGRRIIKLLGLYILGTCFYVTAFDLGSILYYLIIPQNALWYLLSLCCWTSVLPFFNKLRNPIPLTIIISLLIGLVPWVGYAFSLSRTFVYLPFFIAGNLCRRGILDIPARTFSLRTLFCSGVFIWYMLARSLPSQLLLFVLPYRGAEDVVVRFALFSLGTMLMVNIMALIPKHKTFYTRLGENTLFVYLIHEVFVYIFDIAGIYRNPRDYVYLLPFAIVLTFLLSVIPMIWHMDLPGLRSARRLFGQNIKSGEELAN